MSEGQVVSIYIAPEKGEPTVAVDAVRVVPGKGLEGDRYFKQAEATALPGYTREMTLMAMEALEALARESGIVLEPQESRRNVITHGVPLNDLVGREFRIGEVRLRGTALCEPCSTLERRTQPGVLRGLVHRGGLVAQILSEGTLRVGDYVEIE